MPTRRKLLRLGVIAPIANTLATPSNPAAPSVTPDCNERISLNGTWSFRLDPQNSGESQGWHQPGEPADGWRIVSVPHTWQIEPEHADYMGVGWYRRTFEAPQAWSNRAVRVEFEAVFHSATVWLNGVEVGRHTGKGYTEDRIGLLYTISQTLTELALDISAAKICTERGAALDNFYVRELSGGKVVEPERHRAIERLLRQAIHALDLH